MKRFTCLAVLVLVAATTAFAQKYDIKKNIKYREDAFYKQDDPITQRCVLDVAIPQGTKDFPTVVWLHGGGLTGGNKHIPQRFLTNKVLPVAVVAVNYRLAGKGSITSNDCVDDAAAALAWTFKNIASFGGDPTKVFVSGHSAGAYLTLMIGMDPKRLEKYGEDYRKIKGMIPFSGQVITHFRNRTENNIKMLQPTIDAMAPLYFVMTPNLAPILLITGNRELEMCGRYEENAYLYRMLKLNKHKVELCELDGYGHSMAEPACPLLLNFVNKLCGAKAKR